MKKVISILGLVALMIMSTTLMVSAQDEPVYVGADFFAMNLGEDCSAMGACEYYCSWCSGTNYQCSSAGQCCS